MDFIQEILELINLKYEGSYWDFKREWYSNNSDLLHDIICFANNLENKDCYIIIGVDEDKDYSLCDISNDPYRKNTQKIIDFIKDIKFAGGIRPIVYVKSITICGKNIDIIVVKNAYYTPYYLTEKYHDVNANNIYTRIVDTNTPKNKSADINHIEGLWKKRFRINESPQEKFLLYIQDKDNWIQSPTDEDIMFYKFAPEYTIKTETDETRDGYEYYLFTQTDPRPHWGDINIYYHQTIIFYFQKIFMDGYRWSAVTPEHSSIRIVTNAVNYEDFIYYSYYLENNLRFYLHNFLDGKSKSPYEYSKYMSLILLFESENEKEDFEKYVKHNLKKFNDMLKEEKKPYMIDLPDYNMKTFENEYKSGLVLNKMLNDFRAIK